MSYGCFCAIIFEVTAGEYDAPDFSGTLIVGTENHDYLKGTRGSDLILGLGGPDYIFGRGGNDIICGGDGFDIVYGQNGNDTLFGKSPSVGPPLNSYYHFPL